MKKIHMICMALVALFAFSAVLASTAAAENTLLAEWLVGGVGVTTSVLAETKGEILLSDTSNGSDVLCSGIFVGTLGASGAWEVTEVLSLALAVVSLSAPLLCTEDAVCESSTTDVEVSPEGLPWRGLMYLDETSGLFLALVFKAGYDVECLVLGLKIKDECTATESAGEVKNVSPGVEGKEESLTPLGTCSIGGAGTGEVVPLAGNSETTSGGTLTVSE